VVQQLFLFSFEYIFLFPSFNITFDRPNQLRAQRAHHQSGRAMSRPPAHSSSVRSSNGFLSSSPWAQQSILRDLADAEEAEENEDQEAGIAVDGGEDHAATHEQHYSMSGSYRRASYVATGPRPFFPSTPAPDPRRASTQDREAALAEERSLLRDNQLIPPKHPRTTSTASNKPSGLLQKNFVAGFLPRKGSADGESAIEEGEPDENTALLGNPDEPYGGVDTPENIDKRWEEAVASGKIKTTWQREAVVLARYSRSLILTFLLQYSLTVTSVFTVGHIGKLELGAVSLASMSANITGYAMYQGLATSLDTLCPQAFGKILPKYNITTLAGALSHFVRKVHPGYSVLFLQI
jgi:MATE family multidrug resistance protein